MKSLLFLHRYALRRLYHGPLHIWVMDVQKRKRRIVVIGLLGSQEQLLVKAVPEVKFIFLDKQRNLAVVPVADHYVIWGKFIGHDSNNKVRSAAIYYGKKVVIHHKGLKELISKLREEFGSDSSILAEKETQ